MLSPESREGKPSVHASTKATNTNISLVLISSPVANFEENLAWMIRLTIQSALRSFRLPDEKVTLDLLVFFPCKSNFHHPAQPYSVQLVQNGYEAYTRSVFRGIDTVAREFATISFHCAGLFSTAICHLAEKPQMLRTTYFVIEHDWVVLPSQVNLIGGEVADFISHNDFNISYVLLQRGDRSITNNKPLFFHEHSARLYRGRQYSNNPFMSTGKFLKDLTSASGLCTDLTSGHWERRAEKYALDSGLSEQIALLVPSNTSNRANLYHIDGKLLAFAQKLSVGALFEAGNPPHVSFDQTHVIDNLDSYCQHLPNICSPYYLRSALLARVLTYAKSLPCVENKEDATIPHFASAFLNAHGINTVDLEGTFPGSAEASSELRNRICNYSIAL